MQWNPSAQALLNLLDRSKDKEQRGLVIDANNVVFWDSWYAEHDLIAQWLNGQGYDVPRDGERNILVLNELEPKLYVDAAFIDIPVIRRLRTKFVIGGDG